MDEKMFTNVANMYFAFAIIKEADVVCAERRKETNQ